MAIKLAIKFYAIPFLDCIATKLNVSFGKLISYPQKDNTSMPVKE